MAKTIKDILLLLSNQVNSNELSAIVGASDINDVEIEDEDFDKISEQVKGLMTVDRAITNKSVKKELYDLHKKRFMSDVEEMLSPIADKLEVSDKVSELETVKDKLDFIHKTLNEATPTGEVNEEIEKYKKTVEKYKTQTRDLQQQIDSLNSETEEKIKGVEKSYSDKLLRKAFYTELNNRFKLAEAYDKPNLKKKIFEDLYENASKKAHLKLTEGDEIGIFDPELPEKPLILDNNKAAGIEDLVSSDIRDYLKISTPSNTKPDSKPQETKEDVNKPGTFGFDMAQRRREYMTGAGVSTS